MNKNVIITIINIGLFVYSLLGIINGYIFKNTLIILIVIMFDKNIKQFIKEMLIINIQFIIWLCFIGLLYYIIKKN